MSLPALLLVCDTCCESVPKGPYLSAVYSIPGDRTLPLRWTLSWCNSCGHAKRVEAWPSSEDLERDTAGVLREWAAYPQELGGWKQEKLENFETYQRLQPLRNTPNHCLDCGSTDLMPWSYNNEDELLASPHGGCQGLFKEAEHPDGLRFMLVDESDLYTIDGEFVGRVPNDGRP